MRDQGFISVWTAEERVEGGKDLIINLFFEYLLSTHSVLSTGLCY